MEQIKTPQQIYLMLFQEKVFDILTNIQPCVLQHFLNMEFLVSEYTYTRSDCYSKKHRKAKHFIYKSKWIYTCSNIRRKKMIPKISPLSLEIGKRCLKNRYIFRELEERKENKFTL
jgi:hypothetical protein